MRNRVLVETWQVIADFKPRQFGAYALMEGRTHAGGLIQTADANGQQVSTAHIEADARSTRRADHTLAKTLQGFCDEFAAEQSECGSWSSLRT
jgi:hypothetical protein